MHVLAGGLEAWTQAGLPTTAVDLTASAGARITRPRVSEPTTGEAAETRGREATHTHAFLPGLVENYANQQTLPIRRDLSVLFVDIADSTSAVLGQSPEQALAFVQRFMSVVTDAALAYCGDVKDYEGDGALLYFESVSEATRAALSIRETLASQEAGDGLTLRARLSLDVGAVVIGVIGTPMRRSVALIGPTINLAARLLKQIAPGGIIATAAVVEQLREEAPELANRFALFDENLELKGFEREFVIAYAIT